LKKPIACLVISLLVLCSVYGLDIGVAGSMAMLSPGITGSISGVQVVPTQPVPAGMLDVRQKIGSMWDVRLLVEEDTVYSDRLAAGFGWSGGTESNTFDTGLSFFFSPSRTTIGFNPGLEASTAWNAGKIFTLSLNGILTFVPLGYAAYTQSAAAAAAEFHIGRNALVLKARYRGFGQDNGNVRVKLADTRLSAGWNFMTKTTSHVDFGVEAGWHEMRYNVLKETASGTGIFVFQAVFLGANLNFTINKNIVMFLSGAVPVYSISRGIGCTNNGTNTSFFEVDAGLKLSL
jgi:hypothetical protein